MRTGEKVGLELSTAVLIPYVRVREQFGKPTIGTNIAELRVYIREKPTDEARRAGVCRGAVRG